MMTRCPLVHKRHNKHDNFVAKKFNLYIFPRIHWIGIYPVDRVIRSLNNWGLVASAIHLLNNWGADLFLRTEMWEDLGTDY